MASRTTGGTYTNKFDITTHPTLLDQMDEIRSSINRIMDPELRVMNGRIDQLNAQTANQFDGVTQRLWVVERELDRVSSRLRMLESFFRSRFFRFLNFFGRWFIYAPDGSIYENTEENRKLIEDLFSSAAMRGSSD